MYRTLGHLFCIVPISITHHHSSITLCEWQNGMRSDADRSISLALFKGRHSTSDCVAVMDFVSKYLCLVIAVALAATTLANAIPLVEVAKHAALLQVIIGKLVSFFSNSIQKARLAEGKKETGEKPTGFGGERGPSFRACLEICI